MWKGMFRGCLEAIRLSNGKGMVKNMYWMSVCSMYLDLVMEVNVVLRPSTI